MPNCRKQKKNQTPPQKKLNKEQKMVSAHASRVPAANLRDSPV